jgi:hypothetical protein
MEEENNIQALGQGFFELGDLILRNSNYLTSFANIRNEIFRRFDANQNIGQVNQNIREMERRFDEIQGSINEFDDNMIARVANSKNISETSVIHYINVN